VLVRFLTVRQRVSRIALDICIATRLIFLRDAKARSSPEIVMAGEIGDLAVKRG
jgi:hypothetical protein